MYLSPLPQPVEQAYNGGDSFTPRRLQEAINMANGNFSLIQGEINVMRIELSTAKQTNKQLTQLLNWIAVTNPQILDEFQTTAHAFDKLAPREPSEFAGPQSAA
jgi:hypothetical protein